LLMLTVATIVRIGALRRHSTKSKSSMTTWVLAEENDVFSFGAATTCSAACRNRGMECQASEASRITSEDSLRQAMAAAGKQCRWVTSSIFEAGPDIDSSSGECTFLDPWHRLQSSCGAEPMLGKQRLCACKGSAPASTTPEPTTAAPTTPKPTTPKPTTAAPTTRKPTTPKPTTAAPTTPKPTTPKLTTATPTTAAPEPKPEPMPLPTLAPNGTDSSHSCTSEIGHCGRTYQTCCIGFGAGNNPHPCGCKLTDGEGKSVGSCGTCGSAYAVCCAAYGKIGHACKCNVAE